MVPLSEKITYTALFLFCCKNHLIKQFLNSRNIVDQTDYLPDPSETFFFISIIDISAISLTANHIFQVLIGCSFLFTFDNIQSISCFKDPSW